VERYCCFYKNVVKNIDTTKILGVGLSGQMHGSVFLDKENKILRPCILWCDQRTAKECEFITEKIGKKS
jgi:xylulokinase